jgi:hypothetical protein
LVACEDTTGVFHEGEEEVVFVAGEVEGLAGAADDFADGVVVEGVRSGRGIGGCGGVIERVAVGAAEDGADAGGEFAGAERFSDVVVSTEFEADDAIDFAIACGEEEDGDGRGLAEGAADVEAAHIGETDIEDEAVEGFGGEFGEGVATGGGIGDIEAFGSEGIPDGFGDGGFIFDNEDAAGHGGRVAGNA